MDVVGLTLGLSLDNTKRYPLQDITPSLLRKRPHLSKRMRHSGATLLDEVEVTLDSSFIEPGMMHEDIQALQYAHTLSQDCKFIHPNEIEQYMEKHGISEAEAWKVCKELRHKYNDGLLDLEASRAPTPCVSIGDKDPLDWGSDVEYVFSTPHTIGADTSLVSHPQLQRSEGSLYDTEEVAQLYNLYFNIFDVLECEHKFSYRQCDKCNKRICSMWLLDSGVSVHSTFDKEDFIEYKPVSDRQPVKTAAHTIYVEGTGTVLLRHEVNSLPVTM